MATLTICMDYRDGAGAGCVKRCREVPRLKGPRKHVLVPGRRYIVEPLPTYKKDRKHLGRVCTFIASRLFGARDTRKARVKFEDDGSFGHVEYFNLLPVLPTDKGE